MTHSGRRLRSWLPPEQLGDGRTRRGSCHRVLVSSSTHGYLEPHQTGEDATFSKHESGARAHPTGSTSQYGWSNRGWDPRQPRPTRSDGSSRPPSTLGATVP